MSDTPSETLTPELDIALSYTPADLRDRLRAFLTLDRRLSQIVAQTTEPMLGQMRLAWWRDMFAKPVGERPSGDAALDTVSAYWEGEEAVLTALVDAWEEMLTEPPMPQSSIENFAKGRAAGFEVLTEASDSSQAIMAAAATWALGDAAVHIGEGAERDLFVQLALQQPATARLPKTHRGLAILAALVRRSLNSGTKPLMQGRGAALLALKVGLLGQ